MEAACQIAEADTLNARFASSEPTGFLRFAVKERWPDQVACLSSFGIESALILGLIAQIDRHLPVMFIDTGKHFAETITFKADLCARLGLTEVRIVAASPDEVRMSDPDGILHADDPDACCDLRKVRPLSRAEAGFAAFVTGRKRTHGDGRAATELVELRADGRVSLNPLARLDRPGLDALRTSMSLPDHPLAARGYASVGCEPCTVPTRGGCGQRAGRWAGSVKTECGIHLPRATGPRPQLAARGSAARPAP